MANSGGGAIVFRLDEWGVDIAQAATYVLLSDQGVANEVGGGLSGSADALVDGSSRTDSVAALDHGFYRLIVAGSDQAPHAVRKNNN